MSDHSTNSARSEKPQAAGERRVRNYLKSFAQLIERLAPQGMLPPQAVELEQSLLGSMMVDKTAISRVVNVLGDRSLDDSPFYREAHTMIYRAIVALDNRSEAVDVLTVTNQLRLDGKIEEAGGPTYLVELTTRVVTTANVESHARIIVEKYIGRELIRTCEEIKLRAFAGEDDIFDLCGEAEERLAGAANRRASRGKFRSIHTVGLDTIYKLDQIEKKGSEITGVPSGLKDLDNLTGGWQKGDLIIVGARPSMGKSALANKFAHANSIGRPKDERGTTAFVSLEMSDTSLAMRMMAMDAQVSMTRMRKGWMTDGEWDRVSETHRKYTDAPVEIFTANQIDVKRIRAELRHRWTQLNRTDYPMNLVIVDYLTLIDMPGDNQVREIGKVTRTLKLLASELDLAVILLAQLNRDVEKRLVKKPTLSDLRDSGSIEQDGDIIMFLYRPEWYGIHVYGEHEGERFSGKSTKGIAEIIIAKHRNGETGEIKVAFSGEHARFGDIPEDFDSAEQAFRRADEARVQQEDLAF